MKNMKSKLLASVAMLLVSAIMLTSASFAWFTISTAPEITGLTTQVVVNDNLEIALDADYATEADVDAASKYDASDDGREPLTGDPYTWGNLAALASETAYSALDKTLRPAYLDANGKFWYPTYGPDGRISVMAELKETELPETGTGAHADVAFGNLTGENDNVYGYYVDFWIRSNKGGVVELAEAVNRIAGDSTTLGGGSTFTAASLVEDEDAEATDPEKVLSENIRVAFKVDGEAERNDVNQVATAVQTVVPMDEDDEETPAPDGTAEFVGSVVTLTANEAKKVRMYVYLDGQNVTNASASLSGEDADVIIGGNLNLQFTLEGIEEAMDVTGAVESEPEDDPEAES